MDITKIDFEPILSEARQSEAGFAKLLSIIQSYILQKARAILSSYEDAEDIYQIVSIRLYNNLNNINPNAFMSYLKTTVTNACNDELRKRHKVTDEGDQINTVSIDAFEDWDIPAEDNRINLTDEYRNKVVFEILDSLPEKQREVVILRYIDDYKIKDIALQLGVNENTVKTRLYSAFENIKDGVLKVQKRDDIKLYSYSPVLFFLLLLRINNGYSIPTNYHLVNNVFKAIDSGVSRTVSSNVVRTATGNVAKSATANAAGKTAAATSVKVASSAAAGAVKATVLKVVIGAAIVTAAGVGGYVTIDKLNTVKLDASEYVNVDIQGCDNYGNAIIEIDYDRLYEDIDDNDRIKITNRELDKLFNNQKSIIRYDVDKDKNLENGDVIIIELSWDNSKFKDYNFQLAGDKQIRYKVENLPQGIPINPFDSSVFDVGDSQNGVHINIHGFIPNAYVEMYNDLYYSDGPYVYYFIDENSNRSNVKNGDVITIYATFSSDLVRQNTITIDDEIYALTSDVIDYRIENVPEFIASLDSINNEAQRKIWDDVQAIFQQHVDDRWSEYTTLEGKEYVGRFLNVNKEAQDSVYGVLFRYNAYNYLPDLVDASKEVYSFVFYRNIGIQADGSISNLNGTLFSSNTVFNSEYFYYWGYDTLDELIDYLETNYSAGNGYEFDIEFGGLN